MTDKLIRLAFRLFYNSFAFTYDTVADIVSRGNWGAWTRAAIPYIHGSRILEVAFGTGDLHLALWRNNYAPVGLDLSANMIDLTRAKFSRTKIHPNLTRGDVQRLPFPERYFDSVIVTFPASFFLQWETRAEINRVLREGGRLIWVDAGCLQSTGVWNRFLNWALDSTNRGHERDLHEETLPREWFTWQTERVETANSYVTVSIGSPIKSSPSDRTALPN